MRAADSSSACVVVTSQQCHTVQTVQLLQACCRRVKPQHDFIYIPCIPCIPLLQQQSDEGPKHLDWRVAGDEAAVRAKSLAEGADDEVHLVGQPRSARRAAAAAVTIIGSIRNNTGPGSMQEMPVFVSCLAGHNAQGNA